MVARCKPYCCGRWQQNNQNPRPVSYKSKVNYLFLVLEKWPWSSLATKVRVSMLSSGTKTTTRSQSWLPPLLFQSGRWVKDNYKKLSLLVLRTRPLSYHGQQPILCLLSVQRRVPLYFSTAKQTGRYPAFQSMARRWPKETGTKKAILLLPQKIDFSL